jgi:hypothetical protein
MSENEHEEEQEEGIEETLESAIELDTQSQIFLEMRQQNLDLLRVAVEMAGFSGQHPALKPNDVQGALRTVWDIYSEFYSWVDPEESDEDEEEDEDDQ